MPRMIQVPLSNGYDDYNIIRDTLFDIIPFGMINSEFVDNGVTKTGYFTFFDSDYIPDILKKYCKNPPGNNSLVKTLNKALINKLGWKP